MFFKRTLLTILIGATAFSGCGLKIGEKPSDANTLKIGSTQTACLSGASQTLGDYFHGHSSDNEVAGVYTCASNSLKLFKELTTGAKPGVYSPQELRKFMERYFLRDFTISDALLDEFMQLKKTLLGGNTTELTNDEIERLRNLLDILKDVSVKLRPFLPLTPEHVSQLSAQDLESSIRALHDAASELGKVLEERASPYEFSHLDRFLSEIEKFFQDDDYVHNTAEFRKYLPFFVSIKKIIVSPDGTQMAGGDWRILLNRAADLYAILLRASHLSRNESSVISGPGRIKLLAVSTSAYNLFTNVIAANPNNTISFCSIYSVLDEASRLFGYQHDLAQLRHSHFEGYPPYLKHYFDHSDNEDYLWYFKVGNKEIYRGTIKQILLPIVQKFLRPVPRYASTEPESALLTEPAQACSPGSNGDINKMGIRAENLARLWEVVTLTSEGQRYLETVFNYAHDLTNTNTDALATDETPASLLAWVSSDSFVSSLENLFHAPHGNLSAETIGAATVLTEMIRTHLPMFRQNDPYITFNSLSPVGSNQTALWPQSFVGLSAMNAIHNIVQMTWDAYINDAKRASRDGSTGGATEPEIEEFYNDVKELGVELKLFDPNAPGAPKARFFEGNLFTYSANGDQYLSLDEGTDLVTFLFSAKFLSGMTYEMIHERCMSWAAACPAGSEGQAHCHIGGKDIYGKDMIDSACFNHFAYSDDLYPVIWAHMPELASYFKGLPRLGDSAPQKDQSYKETAVCLLQSIAVTSSKPKWSTESTTKWLTSGDVDEISALAQYLEALMVRFSHDIDHQYLTKSDTLEAYPLLSTTLKQKASTIPGASFLKSDEDFQAVLTFILATGKIPSTGDWKSILEFGIRRYVYATDYHADRTRLLQAMAEITNVDSTGCFKAPPTWPN